MKKRENKTLISDPDYHSSVEKLINIASGKYEHLYCTCNNKIVHCCDCGKIKGDK